MQYNLIHYSAVIIDSGVNLSHDYFKDKNANIDTIKITWNDDESAIIVAKEQIDSLGHGTAISSIVARYTQKPILVINFTDNNDEIDPSLLVHALQFVYENISGDVLNLSLGVPNCEEKDILYNVCKKLTDKGFVIVAAFDNLGALSYPAAFDCVIGVLTGELCFSVNEFEYFEDDIVNLGASGVSQRCPWKGDHEFRIISGNSLSCAYVAGKIVQLLYENQIAKNQILHTFKGIAKKIHKNTSNPIAPNNIFVIKKAVLFPFNKEMHSIVRFEDNLNFEIVDVYDTKYSLKIGKNTIEKVASSSKGHIIKNIEKIDWDNFDTLILGHIDTLTFQMKSYDFKKELVLEALKHNKQIYSFDDLSCFVVSDKRIQSPTILPEHLPPFRYEKLHESIVPIVGILGTGGRQGKFTLQVTLRKCLQNKGFQVGQIGTEPSALLFGMDYVFPIGYNSVRSLHIYDNDVIRYLNETIRKLDETRCDIILVGSQSASVNIYPNNLYYYNIFQTLFLMGTRPNAIILSISINDTYEYIERTIKFIESIIECEVIALCLFPVVQNIDWAGIVDSDRTISTEEFIKIKNDILSLFNLPTFLLGEKSQMEDLTNQIISYFS